MKKIICVLLILLSICGCSTSKDGKVEITEDNLFDYFELKLDYPYLKDADGNYKEIHSGNYLLVPKDNLNITDSNLTINVEFEPKWYHIIEENAKSTGQITIGEELTSDEITSDDDRYKYFYYKDLNQAETVEYSGPITDYVYLNVDNRLLQFYKNESGTITINNGGLIIGQEESDAYICYGEPVITEVSGTIIITK